MVLDTIIMCIKTVRGERESHENAGGNSWTTSTVLSSDYEVDRVYNAILMQESMLCNGALAGIILETYVRLRTRELAKTQDSTPGPKNIMELPVRSTSSRTARPQVTVSRATPSWEKRRREVICRQKPHAHAWIRKGQV